MHCPRLDLSQLPGEGPVHPLPADHAHKDRLHRSHHVRGVSRALHRVVKLRAWPIEDQVGDDPIILNVHFLRRLAGAAPGWAGAGASGDRSRRRRDIGPGRGLGDAGRVLGADAVVVAAGAPITQGQWWPAGSPGQWQPRPAGIPEPPPALPPTQEILQAAASLRGAEQSIPPPGVGPEAGRSAVVGAVAKVRSFHGGGCKTYPPVPAFVPGLPLVPPPTAPPAEFAQNLQLSPRAPSEASSGVPSSWLWADIPNDQRGHLCASAMTSSPPFHPPRLEERNIFGCPVRRTDDASDAESIARRVAAAGIDMGASSVSGFSHVNPLDGEALVARFHEARGTSFNSESGSSEGSVPAPARATSAPPSFEGGGSQGALDARGAGGRSSPAPLALPKLSDLGAMSQRLCDHMRSLAMHEVLSARSQGSGACPTSKRDRPPSCEAEARPAKAPTLAGPAGVPDVQSISSDSKVDSAWDREGSESEACPEGSPLWQGHWRDCETDADQQPYVSPPPSPGRQGAVAGVEHADGSGAHTASAASAAPAVPADGTADMDVEAEAAQGAAAGEAQSAGSGSGSRPQEAGGGQAAGSAAAGGAAPRGGDQRGQGAGSAAPGGGGDDGHGDDGSAAYEEEMAVWRDGGEDLSFQLCDVAEAARAAATGEGLRTPKEVLRAFNASPGHTAEPWWPRQHLTEQELSALRAAAESRPLGIEEPWPPHLTDPNTAEFAATDHGLFCRRFLDLAGQPCPLPRYLREFHLSLFNHHASYEGHWQKALHDQDAARALVSSDARRTCAYDPHWLVHPPRNYWGSPFTAPGNVLARVQSAAKSGNLTPELLYQAEALDQYIAACAAAFTSDPHHRRAHTSNHAVPGFVYWLNERVEQQQNQPPDTRMPQLHVPTGDPESHFPGGPMYDLAFAAMPWCQTHYSEGQFREWRYRYQGVNKRDHWQVRSEEKCTDCGFLYISAKVGALFFWKDDPLALSGKHGVCMNSACRRSLWGGYPPPRVYLGEYCARHGIPPPCAAKSLRPLFKLASKIPSEDLRAERKMSREPYKRRRPARGSKAWNASSSGWNSSRYDWTAADDQRAEVDTSGGATSSAAPAAIPAEQAPAVGAGAAGSAPAVGAEQAAKSQAGEKAEAVPVPAAQPPATPDVQARTPAAAPPQEGVSPEEARGVGHSGPFVADDVSPPDPTAEHHQLDAHLGQSAPRRGRRLCSGCSAAFCGSVAASP